MSLRFLFPCPNCDAKFELVTKQAGQSLTCPSCDNKTEAPKLGLLRQLETVGEAPASSNRRAQTGAASGSWKNLLFVCGLGLAILAGTAGYFLYKHAQSRTVQLDIEKAIKSVEDEVDQASPARLMQMYESLGVEKGLGDWVEQPYVGENKQAQILKNIAYGLFAVAGIGLFTLLISFVVPRS